MAVPVFVATTLPQFFLVGVFWPGEVIPPLLNHIRRVFSSESATDGLVRINQKPGDVVVVEVEIDGGVGVLRNPISAES